MVFPSLATDFAETRISACSLCATGLKIQIIEAEYCYAVMIRYDGITDFGRLQGRSFITRDGEAIEGEGVEVYGVVTFSVNELRRDDCSI